MSKQCPRCNGVGVIKEWVNVTNECKVEWDCGYKNQALPYIYHEGRTIGYISLTGFHPMIGVTDYRVRDSEPHVGTWMIVEKEV